MVRLRQRRSSAAPETTPEQQSIRVKRERERAREDEEGGKTQSGCGSQQGSRERKVLRSKYSAVKNLINDERESISEVVSDKFKTVMDEVETLHTYVQTPREQIADAAALLDIANTIVDSVKLQCIDGITPSEFVSSLLREFPPQNEELGTENLRDSLLWGTIGHSVSHVFRRVLGCSTMFRPMSLELKQRRAFQRNRVKPAESLCPRWLDDNGTEETTDTDKNMATMFSILRKKKIVRLEHLILNRNSFAQTVENLFALSFLAKDGRVEITLNNNGHNIVKPRNAPAATAVSSGAVSYCHFVFRFDFTDWKLMLDFVRDGEELMPHRTQVSSTTDSQGETVCADTQTTRSPTTPVRKLSRNRWLVRQEDSAAKDSPKDDSVTDRANPRSAYKKLRVW